MKKSKSTWREINRKFLVIRTQRKKVGGEWTKPKDSLSNIKRSNIQAKQEVGEKNCRCNSQNFLKLGERHNFRSSVNPKDNKYKENQI